MTRKLSSRRRLALAALASAVLCAACGVNAPAASGPAGGPPNILLISIDSLRADRLGCYGASRATSPNLDALAAAGARFVNARAQTPWTLPSHITMMTGLESGVHGIVSGSVALNDNVPTIAETLADHGCRTAAVACAPYLRARWGFNNGFERYDDSLSAPDFDRSHRSKTAALAVDRVIAQIAQLRGRRWFFFLHLWDVHYDYTPPRRYRRLFVDPAYRGRYDVRDWEGNGSFRLGMDADDFAYVLAQYDGGVAWVDNQLGRLFAALKRSGDWPRTAIVVTADHGEEFLDHGGKGHGHTLFDELLRVPLIIKAAGTPVPTTIDCPVGLIDLHATLAELGGAGRDGELGPGVSLVPLLDDPRKCDANRDFYFETTMGLASAAGGKRVAWSGLLRGGWKYIRRYDSSSPMLFHLAVDRDETKNVFERETTIADELRHAALFRQNVNRRQAAEWKPTRDRALDDVTAKQLKQLGYLQ